jgi:K+-transporting ATPase A subunit
MKKNMGIIDRVARIVVAALIAILFFTNVISGTLGIVLLVIAGVFILTAILGSCPLYLPLKLDTGSKKTE